MFVIYNEIEGKNIFKGSESEFVHFVREIAVENYDEELSITCLHEAKEYVEVYCDNLKLL